MGTGERYAERSVLRSEFVYGSGFQGPSDPALLERCAHAAGVRPGSRVLEIGSGLGGAAFYLARRRGARVTGVDAAPGMVARSRRHAAEHGIAGVEFFHGDVAGTPLGPALERELRPASFDVAWSRDCILYVRDKALAWRRLLTWLRPGGRLFVTDFCRGPAGAAGPATERFGRYLGENGYHLQALDAYRAALVEAGFGGVEARDETPAFTASLRREHDGLLARRAEFVRAFGEDDLAYMLERWDAKLAFCESGQMAWGHFTAIRPAGECRRLGAAPLQA